MGKSLWGKSTTLSTLADLVILAKESPGVKKAGQCGSLVGALRGTVSSGKGQGGNFLVT